MKRDSLFQIVIGCLIEKYEHTCKAGYHAGSCQTLDNYQVIHYMLFHQFRAAPVRFLMYKINVAEEGHDHIKGRC